MRRHVCVAVLVATALLDRPAASRSGRWIVCVMEQP